MSIGKKAVCVVSVVEAAAGADERHGSIGGGDDLVRGALTQLVETFLEADTARLSWSGGSTRHSLSLRSEFCRLKVAWRGKLATGRPLSFDDGGLFCRLSDRVDGHVDMSPQLSPIGSGL